MIKVERSAVDLPNEITKSLERAADQAASFYKSKDRSQRRFEFSRQSLLPAKEYLSRLFADTCAFCESSSISPLDVEHFRPTSEAMNLHGKSDPDWYWWLAFEWENLYLCCRECSGSKANYFPVQGRRTRIGSLQEELTTEKNLLLDPCEDDPAEYLRFSDDGKVSSWNRFIDSDPENRAETTIEVLALNRSALIEARAQVAKEVLKNLADLRNKAVVPSGAKKMVAYLRTCVDEFAEYVAVKRQVCARFLFEDRELRRRLRELLPDFRQDVEGVILTELRSLNKFAEASAYKLSIGEKVGQLFKVDQTSSNAYVKRLTIENFRAIENLDIDFLGLVPRYSPDVSQTLRRGSDDEILRCGWKMFLGENGTGKSSILKALALALSGQEFADEFEGGYDLGPKSLIKKGAERAVIKVELTKGEPIVVVIEDRVRFVSGGFSAPGVYLRGFGAARLFPRIPIQERLPEANHTTLKDVSNLFQPELMLSNPERWLVSLTSKDFNSTAVTLRLLLNLEDKASRDDEDEFETLESMEFAAGRQRPPKKILTRRRGNAYLDTGFGPFRLSAQSDGYNSILALAVGILSGTLRSQSHDKSVMPGIVILDEIDSHLHPRWKMRVVDRLRSAFPNIQFIATTHEPLCLRGLGEGEITVLKRIGQRIDYNNNVPSPAGLRIDQLLTSELFGLDSTIDPDIDDKFATYYSLLAQGVTPEGKGQASKLVKQLGNDLVRFNTLGYTRRDQLVYRLIDEYIAREKDIVDTEKRESMLNSTKQRIFDIWDSVRNQLK